MSVSVPGILFFLQFEAGSHYIALPVLELVIFLPQPPQVLADIVHSSMAG